MEYGTWYRSKCCIIVSSIFVVSNVFLVINLTSSPDEPIRRFENASLGIENRSLDSAQRNIAEMLPLTADERNYKLMTEKYTTRLASIRSEYSSSGAYQDVGPPILSLYNVSEHMMSQPKLILLWTTFFGLRDWVKEEFFHACPGVAESCHVTTNKDDLSHSHAVLMHPRDMPKGRRNLPSQRLPWQRWIYFLQESPWHTGIDVRDFNGVFNWTATYRLDSDTPIGYGGLRRRKTPMDIGKLDILLSDITNTKKKLVAAKISNCDTRKTERLRYIAELRKHITVDFYGGCGHLSCPRGEEGDKIMKQYKFYLAFENSNCRDYITEKFWSALNTWSSVPVVMGAAPKDYRAVAPDQAFIHTAGFESPKDLAEYLLLLDRNTHLYKRYFAWHKYWQPESNAWCSICANLYNMSMPVKSYKDFHGWYSEDSCKR